MSRIRLPAAAALVLLVAVVFAAPASASTLTSEATAATPLAGFVETIIKDGGIIGIVIILLSVAALALIIEYAVNVRRDKICSRELIDELEALLEEDELQEAIDLCDAEPNFLTNSLAAGLIRMNEGYPKMQEAIEGTAGIEAVKLQQKVSWMLFLSNLSPMLGLFGTVSGMIDAFESIVALGDKVKPQDLASGIKAALVTTFLGLLVAIPAVSAYQFFRNRATKISIDFAGILEDLTERFRGR